jgi:hypothetical protein
MLSMILESSREPNAYWERILGREETIQGFESEQDDGQSNEG